MNKREEKSSFSPAGGSGIEMNLRRRARVISVTCFSDEPPKRRHVWTSRNRPTLYNGLYLFRRGRL